MSALDDIRARLQAATPGPWFAVRYYVGAGWDQSDPHTEVAKASFKQDAELIAHAPTDVSRLVAAVEAVEALAAAWEARGKHLMQSAEDAPWDVQESLDDSGQDFIHNARLVRAELAKALGEVS
ncbi:hypothetical protein [Pseudarthrobacter sp. LT1]|uniref:hypothetical protein n=1 Tax=Pseudarthrobacter sp. LT1 TaxID=3111450 RepID=UPI002D77909F|nr:hypothetical protein [Pseudarthrobacter sp. LT1]WRT14692.1 hypothetical protein VIK36_04135 [Pseudarthrobacter sp. LT1]